MKHRFTNLRRVFELAYKCLSLWKRWNNYCRRAMEKVVVFVVVMASSVVAIFAAAPSPDIFTFLGIGSNDSCANVDCMQGTCVPNDNVLVSLLFPYTCQCNSGWSTLARVVPFLEIPSLPCNVPNCTLNLNCNGSSPVASPAPSATPITSANTSSCLIPGICGHGKCEVTSVANSLLPTFKCVCDAGYANVLNMTAGFCVNHCEINGSCQNLNITLPGLGSPPPPPPSPPAENQTANAGTPLEQPPRPSSPSTSPGCRSISFHGGFYMVVVVVALGWSSLRMLFC